MTRIVKEQLEDKVEASCAAYLKRKGWFTFSTKVIGRGGDRFANPLRGFPDRICLHPELGRFVYIEFKRTKGGKISIEQLLWHELLRACKQEVFVISSLEALKKEGF